MSPVREQSPKSRRLSTLLRLGLAVGLFGLLFWLVPLQDRLHWEGTAGAETWKGRMTLEDEGRSCRFEAGEGRSILLLRRGEGSEIGWTHVVLPGEPERKLTDEERASLREQPEQGLITTLKNLSPLLFLAALSLYFVGALISFQRWHLLLSAVNVKAAVWRVHKLGFFGLFFSNIIPGMTGGDLVKAIYVAREHPGQRPEAVLSVLVDRAIGLFGLALVACVALLFKLGEFEDLAFSLYGLLGALLLLSAVLFSRRLRRRLRLDRLLGKLPAAEILRKLDRAVLLYRDTPVAILVSVVLSLLVHCLILAAIGLLGMALTLPVESFWIYFALAPLPLIIQAVPIAPAGIGVGEAAFVWILATRADLMTGQQALALALSYRAVPLLVSLLGGILLFFDGERRITVAELKDGDSPGREGPGAPGATGDRPASESPSGPVRAPDPAVESGFDPASG